MVTSRFVILILPYAGFTLWIIAFGVIYGAQGLGCALGWDDVSLAGPVSLLHAALAALLALFLGLGLAVLRLASHVRETNDAARPARFLASVGLFAGIAAAVATVLTFAPIFIASACI